MTKLSIATLSVPARIAPAAIAVLALAGCALFAPRPAPAFAQVEGTAFYLFQPGYVCASPMDGTKVASWVDKVEVHEGRLLRWGTRCGGAGVPVPAAERAGARIGGDGQTITLAGKVYRRSADPEHDAGGRP